MENGCVCVERGNEHRVYPLLPAVLPVNNTSSTTVEYHSVQSMPFAPGVTFIYACCLFGSRTLARPSVVDEIIVVPKQSVANQTNSICELDFCIRTINSH
jgi:hypothetical protein